MKTQTARKGSATVHAAGQKRKAPLSHATKNRLPCLMMAFALLVAFLIQPAPHLFAAQLYSTIIDDGVDFYQRGAAGLGLPTWRVSEPFTSLWIQYPVIRYTTSAGKTVSLDLACRQRGALSVPGTFGFGSSWQCSWLSIATYDVELDDSHIPYHWDVMTTVNVIPPLGGSLAYTSDGNTPEYNTFSKMTHGAINSSCWGTDFTVSYPDGSQIRYDYRLCPPQYTPNTITNYISWTKDPQGRQMTFNYTTNTAAVLLSSVVDYDNRTNLFIYDSTFTNQVRFVVDPYLRTNTFQYDNTGRLTNIINAAGMSSSFVYDSQGVITNMITPYGTNVFKYTVNTNSGNVVNRSMDVTECDGRRHLFIYRGQSTKLNTNSTTDLLPYSYTNEVPNTSTFSNSFDNIWVDGRNSFYWSPHCYAQLSTNYTQPGDPNALTLNDYKLASLTHWLLETSSGGSAVGNIPSMARGPSPDGVLDGQKAWFDYAGKPTFVVTNVSGGVTNYSTNYYTYMTGTTPLPSLVGAVLPDSTTRFGYSEYNICGLPTRTVNTYSVGSGVGTRTNTYLYAANGNDLTQLYGASGELLASNVFNSLHQITTNYNAAGDKTVLTYNAQHQVSGVLTPTGLSLTNLYYASGQYSNFLQSVIVLGIGATNSFTYTNGLVYSPTDERGVATTNTWDKLQRLTSLRFPDGTVVSNAYNRLDLAQVTDRLGNTTSFGYNSLRQKTSETNALGRTTFYGYCEVDHGRDAEHDCVRLRF